MCGICGFIDTKGLYGETLIDQMLDLIIHRGPDDFGKYQDGIVTLGHRRLSILDLSSDGRQPMSYMSKTVITFNGEIYNYLELRKELQNQGYLFSTQTDTEVLLAAYNYWGEECVKHFNGMWAFAIFDKFKNTLFCSRDRFGIKPFYYYSSKSVFAFASEIKQLLPFLNNAPVANLNHLVVFLVNGFIDYSDDTMFENIKQLPGGYNLLYDLNTLKYEKKRWYDLKEKPLSNNTQDEDNTLFSNNFRKSVALRLNADVPVGSCLSGGMDSSAIVCAVHALLEKRSKRESQHTVSSCFSEKEYDEQEYIDAVVKNTGVKAHKVFPDMNQFLKELDDIIWHMDEPFGSTSIYAQWNVFREAKKQGLTVMLDGQGADEQLGGYTGFYGIFFTHLLRKRKFKKLWFELNQFKKLRAGTEKISILLLLIKALLNAYLPFNLQNQMATFYHTRITDSPFPKEFYKNEDIYKIKKLHNPKNEHEYIYACIHSGLSSLLHYEDRDSMAHSIESRVPFLDYRLVEDTYAMPLEHKIKDGKTKYVLREGLKDLLPEEIYNRYSKLAFATPEDIWCKNNSTVIRKELENACDILSQILNKDDVLNWYDRNISHLSYGSASIFRIICAAHWVKIFNVKVM